MEERWLPKGKEAFLCLVWAGWEVLGLCHCWDTKSCQEPSRLGGSCPRATLQLRVFQVSARTTVSRTWQPNSPVETLWVGLGGLDKKKTVFCGQVSLMALQPLEDGLCLMTAVTS